MSAGGTDSVATSLRCPASHSFDIAKQGYVSLLDPRSAALRADTAAMIAARHRVHDAGFFTDLADDLADAAVDGVSWTPRRAPGDRAEMPAESVAPLIVDLGSGPGHYLRAALRRVPGARGLGIDLSKYAARAVARGEPAAGAIVADVWRELPVRSGVADIALSVFAPRNPDETARILRPGGRVVIVTPESDHLAEIVGAMGMLSVDKDKDDRLAAAMSDGFDLVDRHRVTWRHDADAALVADLAGMGPAAFHRTPDEIAGAADRLAAGGTAPVHGAVGVSVYRPRR
ncbi:methyltransferase domain-containing protein [Gordonia sinesedis]